mgnify:CR=1 FL=1
MKEKYSKKKIIAALSLLTLFVLWTVAVSFVNVRAIGPEGSPVGFAILNSFVHKLTGVHMALYTITDWLGILPLGIMFAFAALGLSQWIRRKSIFKVDRSIIMLGVFYIFVAIVYLLFETIIINYRPVLIEGILEASYPSSTTVLALCIIPTAMMQFNIRIRNRAVRYAVLTVLAALASFMVIGRFISGVHWASDIIGGTLLSAGMVVLYDFICSLRITKE